MDPLLEWMRTKQEDLILFLRELVECESPSDDPAALRRMGDLLADRLSGAGKVKRHGPHLVCEFRLPGRSKDGQILGLGHMDTVWPVGTLQTMPWRRERGRLWGPGVFDMKSGLALFLLAMRGLAELEIPVRRRVLLLVVADEEVGSETSRELTERLARESVAVLVAEPSAGLEGNAKTARKGVGDYTVKVTGKAAHAGLDFASGASAIDELAYQIGRISTFTQLERGVTVNAGVIRGGTRTNVVAAEAEAEIDFRVPRMRDWEVLRKKFASLKARDRRCRVEVTGGLNRPPLERTPGVVKLYRLARKLAGEMDVTLGESAVGGGSDGNFTAGLGIPTLDGIGGVGEGAHASHESVLIDRLADRGALLAKLVAAI